MIIYNALKLPLDRVRRCLSDCSFMSRAHTSSTSQHSLNFLIVFCFYIFHTNHSQSGIKNDTSFSFCKSLWFLYRSWFDIKLSQCSSHRKSAELGVLLWLWLEIDCCRSQPVPDKLRNIFAKNIFFQVSANIKQGKFWQVDTICDGLKWTWLTCSTAHNLQTRVVLF